MGTQAGRRSTAAAAPDAGRAVRGAPRCHDGDPAPAARSRDSSAERGRHPLGGGRAKAGRRQERLAAAAVSGVRRARLRGGGAEASPPLPSPAAGSRLAPAAGPVAAGAAPGTSRGAARREGRRSALPTGFSGAASAPARLLSAAGVSRARLSPPWGGLCPRRPGRAALPHVREGCCSASPWPRRCPVAGRG